MLFTALGLIRLPIHLNQQDIKKRQNVNYKNETTQDAVETCAGEEAKKKQTNKQKKKNCSASRLIDNSLLAHGVFCARCTSPTLL